jgi:hypothetical protein
MITGQVNESEYIDAHNLARQRITLAVNVVTLFAACAGVVLLFTDLKQWGYMLLVGGIGGFIGNFVQSRLYLPWRLRRLYAQVRGRTDVTYSWNMETLSMRSDRGNAEIPWTNFRKAKENEQVMLLYVNDVLFHIISKRWFGSHEQVDDFRRNIRFLK